MSMRTRLRYVKRKNITGEVHFGGDINKNWMTCSKGN